MRSTKGFTLIELMVVLAILGILAGLTVSSFMSSQMKGRDAQRKNDLEQMQTALEMYFNDKGGYPDTIPNGGDEWQDTSVTNGALYMKTVPQDPKGEVDYLYYPGNCGLEGSLTLCGWYKIYAKLENTNDPILAKMGCGGACGPGGAYNYYVGSSDAPAEGPSPI